VGKNKFYHVFSSNTKYSILILYAMGSAPDLGKGPGTRAPHQKGLPTMFMCLALCTTYPCHFIHFY